MNMSIASIVASKHLVFVWTDYLLFGGLLGLSLLIGLFFAFCSKQNSASEYLFGGKHMSYVPVAISVCASMISGISLIGVPTEVYFHGAYYLLAILTNTLLAVVTIYIFIPVFYKLQLSSIYEYLELRFSRKLRMFASIMYIIALLLYIPIVAYVPALAFSQVTGYNLHIITPILSLVCITYTTLGGVKAVIWTDTIQFIFTLGGLITVMVLGLVSVGGFPEVLKIANSGGRLNIIDLNPSPLERYNFWGVTFGLCFTWMSTFSVGQKFVQRLLSIQKEKDINKCIILVAIMSCIVNVAAIFLGLIMYAKYHSCDPLSIQVIQRDDQIVPYFVMDVAVNVPGLPGIFLAGIASSALATMSAALNTLSGTIYEDFIDHRIQDGPKKDSKAANIMKGLSLITGLISIGLIFIVEHLGSIFEVAISLRSVVEGPLLGVFILGLVFPMVGEKGALSGGCTSLIIMTWISAGTKWHQINKRIKHSKLPLSVESCSNDFIDMISTTTTAPSVNKDNEPFILFQISIMYLVMIGTLITVIVGLFTSYVNGEWKVNKVNPEYLTPVVRRLYYKTKYEEVALREAPLEK